MFRQCQRYGTAKVSDSVSRQAVIRADTCFDFAIIALSLSATIADHRRQIRASTRMPAAAVLKSIKRTHLTTSPSLTARHVEWFTWVAVGYRLISVSIGIYSVARDRPCDGSSVIYRASRLL